MGVHSSQAKATLSPSIDYEKDTVVGTMMKMYVKTSISHIQHRR